MARERSKTLFLFWCQMRKVLIVAYNFPPVGGAGVQRSVKFVKYLRFFGWEPVVISVLNPSVPVVDATLPKDIPEGVQIYRARSFEPSYQSKQVFASPGNKSVIKGLVKKCISTILLPDIQVLWWPDLVLKLISAIRNEKPECIFVSAPPFSSFIPVVIIAKLFGLPVVLDYRDEWDFSRNTWENSSKTRFAFYLDSLLERFSLQNIRAFTATTQKYIDNIVTRYGTDNVKKGTVITNGYDVDDFNVNGLQRSSIEDPSIINIVYTGTVMSFTSLKSFCDILKNITEKNEAIQEKIRLHVYGRVVGDELKYLNNESLKGMVQCYGYIEHEKVIEEMVNADILLLTLSDLVGAENMINGKTFEYMASGRHIFAVIPQGELSKLLLDNYDNVTIVNPRNIEAATNALLELINNIETIRSSPCKDVSCFRREYLTERLAFVLEKATQ